MAKGYPDYFGTSIWPKYGTLLIDADDVTTADATETTVFELTGAGVWAYLLGILSPAATGGAYTIKVYVDGELFFILTSASAYVCGYNESPLAPLVVNYSDVSADLVHVMLTHEIPFHDSIKITVTRAAAVNVTFDYRVGWYKVT